MKKSIGWIQDINPAFYLVRITRLGENFDIQVFPTCSAALNNLEVLRSCNLITLDITLPAGYPKVGQLLWRNDGRLGLALLKSLREEHDIQTPILAFSEVPLPTGISAELQQYKASPMSVPIEPRQLQARVKEELAKN